MGQRCSACWETGGTGFLLLKTPLSFRMSPLVLADFIYLFIYLGLTLKLVFVLGRRCFVSKGFLKLKGGT